MRADWLPQVLRDAGLKVVETDGWLTRGKDFDAMEGVFAHHTASPHESTLATNLHVVTNGNSIAPGPIAQILLWRDGTCYIIAAGRANHAGAGGPWKWLPASVPGVVSPANRRCFGIEMVNDGVGEPWPVEQVDAGARAAAAILRKIGQGADREVTHHEWAPTRKIDPAGPTSGMVATLPGSKTWDGDSWRLLVASHLNPTPPPIIIPPEDHMATRDLIVKAYDGPNVNQLDLKLLDTATFVLTGGTATWVNNEEALHTQQYLGTVPAGEPQPIARSVLKAYRLLGPEPPAGYGYVVPGRVVDGVGRGTMASDFMD